MVDQGSGIERAGGVQWPRLVLADDDAVVRSMLGAQLEYVFEVVGAAVDAEEAIALVEAHRPDIAILDVNMPGGGARRATREIRARSPETAIVILSADESDDHVIELMTVGAITYLRKGIDGANLVRTLLGAIEAHRTLRGASALDRPHGHERAVATR
jgi:DNA-binding NarL/FixJ family response regulator